MTRWRRPSGARIIIGIVIALTTAYGGVVLAYDVQSDPPLEPCWGNLSGFLSRIFSLVRICIDLVIPFLIIVSTNVILVKSVLKSKEATDSGQRSKVKVKQLTQPANVTEGGPMKAICSQVDLSDETITRMEKKEKEKRKKKSQKEKSDRQLLIRLIFISLAFLLLTLPRLTIVAFSSFYKYRSRSLEFFTIFKLVMKCGGILLAVRPSINCLIYYGSGSKFRRDVKSMFGM